jgi:hypothetical protein
MARSPDLAVAEAKLKDAQDKARRRKMGPPLALSGAALVQAAALGPVDLAAAQAFWRRHTKPGVKRLVEATADA